MTQIVFLEDNVPGSWDVRGDRYNGDPWKEERFES